MEAFYRLGERGPSAVAGLAAEPLLPCGSGRPEQRQRPRRCARRRTRRQAQMREYPDHHGGLLDGSDDLQVAATLRAMLDMNTTQRGLIMQRWSVIQQELMPELRSEVGPLTPRLERVIHTLEWVRIEDFVESTWCGVGRPPHDRGALASAFVAKAVLGLTTTEALIERLKVDRALRRICGFSMWKRMPAPATFSRAFDEFAQAQLAQRVHEALVKEPLGQALIGRHQSGWHGDARRERSRHARRRPNRRPRRSVAVRVRTRCASLSSR